MTLEVDSGGFTAANIENNSIAMKTALNVFLFKCSSLLNIELSLL